MEISNFSRGKGEPAGLQLQPITFCQASCTDSHWLVPKQPHSRQRETAFSKTECTDFCATPKRGGATALQCHVGSFISRLQPAGLQLQLLTCCQANWTDSCWLLLHTKATPQQAERPLWGGATVLDQQTAHHAAHQAHWRWKAERGTQAQSLWSLNQGVAAEAQSWAWFSSGVAADAQSWARVSSGQFSCSAGFLGGPAV